MHRLTQNKAKPEAAGLVIHGAARYDLIVWLFTLGGERRLREKMLRLAELRTGEDILDIGCGTGTLAILAKRQVGDAGVVHGVDAAPEMIARARTKAKRAGIELVLAEGVAQALPLPDSAVDVVISTLMLHHLPRKARPDIVREIKRVLKPGGRFLAVDFVKPAEGRKSFMDRFHRHGFVRLEDVIGELEAAGFTIARKGLVGERDLQFVMALNGAHEPPARAITEHAQDEHPNHVHADVHRHGGSLMLALLGGLGVAALVALHGGALWSLRSFAFDSDGQSLALYGVVALALLLVGFFVIHVIGARMINRWLGARAE